MKLHFVYILVVFGLVIAARFTVTKQCVFPEGCFRINVPDQTLSTGNRDVFIQLQAPTTYSYLAIGTGHRMQNSKMLIMYTSSNGRNVIVSGRKGLHGHSAPTYDPNLRYSVLEGSVVEDGMMTANVRCYNCSTDSTWIYAALSGPSIDSDSLKVPIQQHTHLHGRFNFDMSKARGGTSSNPFGVGSAPLNVINGPPRDDSSNKSCNADGGKLEMSGKDSIDGQVATSCYNNDRDSGILNGTDLASNQTTASQGASNNSTLTGVDSASNLVNQKKKIRSKAVKHAVLACLAFLGVFPFGGVMIRLMSIPGVAWLHALVVGIGMVFFSIAFALGMNMARSMKKTDTIHVIFGVIIFGFMWFQPLLGLIHHSNFKKYQERTSASHLHLWIGRITITVGIINGGLGFKLARQDGAGVIIYAIFATILWLTYVGLSLVGEWKRAQVCAQREAYSAYMKKQQQQQQQKEQQPEQLRSHG